MSVTNFHSLSSILHAHIYIQSSDGQFSDFFNQLLLSLLFQGNLVKRKTQKTEKKQNERKRMKKRKKERKKNERLY